MEDRQQHKTMIKQLTDLDDHELDEQAGLFMHPRRKSLRTETTPRPLSQPFFQPLQVFPDVLSVSAMVERQEQKDSREQRDEAPTLADKALSSGTATPASALAQYPQGLALHSHGTDAASAEPPALRSVSLTRVAEDAPLAGTDDRSKRPGVLTASPLDDSGLRGTPVGTPTEEGDRQLSVETSRPNRPTGRRGASSKRLTASTEKGPGRSGRLFIRRANASSRGSEDENSSNDEQFIYRNSRSSLHVSSIPEEHDHADQAPKRRPNRHRMSTFLASGERRESAGVGRAGGSAVSAGSFAYGSGATAHGSSATGARPGRRAPGRGMRAGGSVNTSTAASGGPLASSINAHHRFSILTHPNNDFGLSSEESDVDAEPAGLRSTYNSNNLYSRRNSRRQQSNVYYGSSEEMPESTPLFRRHVARRKHPGLVARTARAVGLSVLLLASLFVLVALFNLTSAPLAEVEAIKITNILATEKELLFIMHVQATNPNVRQVLVERADIGVFAAAAVSPGDLQRSLNASAPAILLGNVYELNDPMRFTPGSLRKEATDVETTQISIHRPGGVDDDGSDSSKWRDLLKGPYDLTVRGTLQYTLWQRNYAARICIAKLANLPPDANKTAAAHFLSAAGMGCDDDDWDEPITLPLPPSPPLVEQ
ncbi:Vacuolar inheritance and morphology protein [Coemansia sp. RSA 989]|nr:Vacuolar inheritance and morphology protein [Coemansia sp. RSA 1086]KAJ1748795.1 Vacuolar inheritance and morphology protein [Coemansia sp. RSA 1821]KAJ1862884.1 Vacuolar inheritance and morphology protein [Coemansia sp. RSA 989]KAJ1870699.1 Vacuolar inheritance and morphology protein [Coemansia sp. RSA 990]KAJ2653579.1 Vacuolar inheritance and morphology protein [Coemansia sp. RSA 1250]KAJ2677292.1 Vacuolar inheritance and morphology protein [Coemansia sp. RSA 1085]